MRAAERGNAPIVNFLLSKGANKNLKSGQGLTALDYAESQKKETVASMLLGPEELARKYGKPLTTESYYVENKTQTSLRVKPGDRLVITATGEISLGFFVGSTGPDGIDGYHSYNLVRGNFKHGMLLVRIKQRGGRYVTHAVGSNRVIVPEFDGRLEFIVNDAEPRNNSGEFDIVVTVYRPR